MPPKIEPGQAVNFAKALAKGEPNREKIALTVLADKIRELIQPGFLPRNTRKNAKRGDQRTSSRRGASPSCEVRVLSEGSPTGLGTPLRA